MFRMETDEMDKCLNMKQGCSMKTAEFQLESHTGGIRSPSPDRLSAWPADAEALQAGIQSLLLGLRLRGWLTNSEKRLLDLLAPENWTTFMCRDGRYLHPEGLDSLPMELADVPLSAGNAAIFTHRYGPSPQSHFDCQRIHAALLNPEKRPATVLGMFGSEAETPQRNQSHYFADLLLRFRQAANSIEPLVLKLEAALENKFPTAVINRASGRIVSINTAFHEALARHPEGIIDQEYSQLTRDLKGMTSDSLLKMHNINHAALNLTIVSMKQLQINKDRRHLTSYQFLTHRMRNKIAAITTAASCVEKAPTPQGQSDTSELVGMILKETSELDHYLTRLNLIVNHRQLETSRTSLKDELERAVALVNTCQEKDCVIETTGPCLSCTVTAALQAPTYLFEAILHSHLARSDVNSRTVITGEKSDSGDTLMIRFETEQTAPKPPLQMEQNWKNYAALLSDQMGIKIEQDSLSGKNKLVTRIHILC